jgi:hypothetical protein
MKIKILFFLLITVVSFSQKKKINEEYDYINNYYQFVYQANYEYLSGNYQKAYNLLKTAEKNCPLLNQTGIYEPRILAACALKLGNKKEAFKYANILVKDHGFALTFFENDTILNGLKNYKEWGKLEKKSKKHLLSYKKSVDLELRKELLKMTEEDQSVRINQDYEGLRRVDSINNLKLRRIVSQCDCFPDEMFSQFGNFWFDGENLSTTALVFHINIEDSQYWKPVFLDLIRRGRAPANIYGDLVDSILRNNGIFEYGIYQNVGKELINDFENLDNRRIAVGLPTKDYQDFVYEYWQKMFKKYNIENVN